MAFDEDMKMAFEEEEQHYLFSRLSVCSNFDADGELSDSAGDKRAKKLEFSHSDKESPGIQSLPATPPRRRRRQRTFPVSSPNSPEKKAYASENELRKEKQGSGDNNKNNRRRKLRPDYPPWVSSMRRSYVGDGGGYGGGGGGVVVVTRPIGGGRPLCMDLGEVKACKDLGFELEPGQVSYSGGSTNMDATTNSGGNSPSHRISSPGDDPKEVKARLKAWAQAVAFVSTTHKSITKK